MGSGTKIKHASYAVAPAEQPKPSVEEEHDIVPSDMAQQDRIWAGLDDADAWYDLGVPAEVAATWSGEGFHPGAATSWMDAGFTAASASDWVGKGITTPQDALAWSGIGCSADEAANAILHHHSPTDIIVQGAKQKFEAPQPPPVLDEETEDELDEEPEESELDYTVEDVAPISTLADAGTVTETAWGEAVTPIPEGLAVGDPHGLALLVGGADLEDSSATIMAYAPASLSGAVHEVLFCKLNEEAEDKLLEALAPEGEALVPVEKEFPVTGRVEFDTEQQLYEKLVTAAKSVNHHLKEGDGPSGSTLAKLQAAKETLDLAAASDEPTVAAMAAHYKPLFDAYDERAKEGFSIPYLDGGKGPAVTPFETDFMKTEVVWEPDQSEGPKGQALLASSSRAASRVSPHVTDGSSVWDGHSRSKAHGKEYVIKLPNGYTAVYHPYSYLGQNLAEDDFSLRGRLELHAPAGEGHAKELVDVLGSLNVVNRPMNGAEAEWTYLVRNIDALGLKGNPQIQKAIASSKALEGPVQEALILDHADEAAALYGAEDLEGIQRLVDLVTLEAEAAALPYQVRIVRNAFASTLGIPSGKDLVDHPAYRPMPRKAAGRMIFDRFDVAKDHKQLEKAFAGKRLSHSLHGSSVLDVFKNGGILASQERRRIMGVQKGIGSSEASDVKSGGASGIFASFGGGSGSHAGQIYWNDPLRLLRRTDWYGYGRDHFGSVNPQSGHPTHGKIKSVHKLGDLGAAHEIIFADGFDLLGDDAPTRVVCKSASERDAVRKLLAGRGITHLGKKLVDEVVVSA